MANDHALRRRTASALANGKVILADKKTLLGFDGFVDEIVRMVDKRESNEKYTTIDDLTALSNRIAQAAGKGTNIELIVQQKKIGGNGPIMADALTALGFPVTYIGVLGRPSIHPVFRDFAKRASVISIAEPAHTDALEFEDGKIMLGKMASFREVTWDNLIQRVGYDHLLDLFQESELVGLTNWTMTPDMSDIWKNILSEVCPKLVSIKIRRTIFFDLADPEKRTKSDIREALDLISQFERYYHVILGSNEKEGYEIAEVLGISEKDNSPEGIQTMCAEIRERLKISTVVVHPRAYAVAARQNQSCIVAGPFTPKPLISTGAGDHFNAGFCFGCMLELPFDSCLLTGVAASGYYVRTGKSPSVDELVKFINDWPEEESE